ncbi:roadblock/LC7 domain-containing protein [Hamadaea tsunoensis]|uniref:roadblock/LC7 domain-containing protein n=1 Tax=Hamadaea tsunoensis TaxID=53368 RepID=UPI000409D419|nr:roadblock/LC7 domain-containing protein [Hamadaea tsunoensis]
MTSTLGHAEPPDGAPTGLGWLLDDLREKVPAARNAVLLSVDGLVIGRDATMDPDEADHLAAAAAGLASIARGAGRRFDGGDVRSTVIEFDKAYLLISDAGHRTCLAVLTDSSTDLGMLAYEAELMITRVGEHLATGAR